MHSDSDVRAALQLAERGATASEIARGLGFPRSTVRDWLAGALPGRRRRLGCPTCGASHDFATLAGDYIYLLGMYLGDGCLSEHRRSVYKLRIYLDAAYPGIIDETRAAINVVRGRAPAQLAKGANCIEVFSFWRQWICLFPQHARGKKHDRPIVLTPWQLRLVDRWPEQLLRGLIQSDGCRFQNTGRGGWSAPRYAFSNRSGDIHGIFRAACERLGVAWTNAGDNTTYVSRKADVATLDRFIGPKR
ncbi:MAG: helix-turn-helix domain-containing protein [Solirubrobacteraceae bacterium]